MAAAWAQWRGRVLSQQQQQRELGLQSLGMGLGMGMGQTANANQSESEGESWSEGQNQSLSEPRVSRVLSDEAKSRRFRVATVVLLRSFIAPLLLHSIGHSLPSWFSHEIIVDVEELVDGAQAVGSALH